VKRDQNTNISVEPAPPPPVALPWRNDTLRVASRDRLEKLTVVHLAEKYPAFYGTRRFIIVSQLVKPDRFISFPISVKVSSHLCLGHPSGSLPSGVSHPNLVCVSPFPQTCDMPCWSCSPGLPTVVIFGKE
jgi:hypothetical protein